MKSLGFKNSGRNFISEQTDFYVEFPPGPVSIGDELIENFNEINGATGLSLKLLSPLTQLWTGLLLTIFGMTNRALIRQ